MIKISHIAIFGIILLGVIAYYEWRDSNKTSLFLKLQQNTTHGFLQLSDSLSARSQTVVVKEPTFIDRVFHTDDKKQYEEFLAKVPEVIRKELENYKNPQVIEITKNSILITGDSVRYFNKEGVITKTCKITPLNEDSSLLVVVPQNIEITSVEASPDAKIKGNSLLYLTAFNKTTGDTLRISQSVRYTLKESDKWKLSFKPYFSAGYNFEQFTNYPAENMYLEAGATVLTKSTAKYNFGILTPKVTFTKKSQMELELFKMQLK